MHISAKTIFSLEEVSKKQYERAFKNHDKYYIPVFHDTVIEDNVTAKIIMDARQRFEIDTIFRDSYDIPTIEEEYEQYFSIKSLYKSEFLGIYGFNINRIHDSIFYCYDISTGEYMGEMICPFSISPKGIIVSQIGHDCDIPLDLVFYTVYTDIKRICDYWAFREPVIRGPFTISYPDSREYNLNYFMFWGSENELYMSVPNFKGDEQPMYYKITLNTCF